MKGRLFVLLSTSLVISTATFADEYQNTPSFAPAHRYATQIGLALEDRTNYADAYLYISQVIDKRWFWELRSYLVRNYIVTAPPTQRPSWIPAPVPAPTVDEEENLWGGGVVGMLGYVFHLTDKTAFTPFVRLQYYRNTATPYKDTLGNELQSEIVSYFMGAKLQMEVNEIFGIHVSYYGGYQTTDFDVSGYYHFVPDDNRIIQLSSTFEIGSAYKINRCWTFIPYVQYVITSNKPTFNASVGPINNNGLTTNSTVFAAKIAYTWS